MLTCKPEVDESRSDAPCPYSSRASASCLATTSRHIRLLTSAPLIASLFLISPIESQAQTVPTQRREVVYGVVRDSSGAAIKASDVVLTVGGTFQVLRGVTDSTGSFRIVVDSAGPAGAGGGG